MMSVNLSTAGARPLRVGDVLLADDIGSLTEAECRQRASLELLRQAARSGDLRAQLELGRHYCQPRQREPLQARHWLEAAAAQGSHEAARLLQRLNP